MRTSANVQPVKKGKNRDVFPYRHEPLTEEEYDLKLQAQINKYIHEMITLLYSRLSPNRDIPIHPVFRQERYTDGNYIESAAKILSLIINKMKTNISEQLTKTHNDNDTHNIPNDKSGTALYNNILYSDLYRQYKDNFSGTHKSPEQKISIAHSMKYLWFAISLKEIINTLNANPKLYTHSNIIKEMFQKIQTKKIPGNISYLISKLLNYLSSEELIKQRKEIQI